MPVTRAAPDAPAPFMNKCYSCIYRQPMHATGVTRYACAIRTAKVTASPFGLDHGWFDWPMNFDPTWLVTCDSYDRGSAPEES